MNARGPVGGRIADLPELHPHHIEIIMAVVFLQVPVMAEVYHGVAPGRRTETAADSWVSTIRPEDQACRHPLVKEQDILSRSLHIMPIDQLRIRRILTFPVIRVAEDAGMSVGTNEERSTDLETGQ
jgi:hypothetical protein